MVEVNIAAADEWDTDNEAPDGDDYEEELEPDQYEDETDDAADEYEDEADAPPTKEPKFVNVIEWVNGFFLPVIRRRISDNDGGLSWV